MMVSIIIPFFKNASWLNEALLSIAEQSYTDFEVIIVDDGSKEYIQDILREFNFTINYLRIENSGAGVARNLGIDNAIGKYIAFLDSDDLWTKDKLKEQVEFMENHSFVWSHTDFVKFDDSTGLDLQSSNVTNFSGIVYPYCLISCPIATPCVMIQSQIFKANNNLRFNSRMRQGQDTFLWISLAELFPLGIVKSKLTKVRFRGNNTSTSALNHLKAKSNLWEYFVRSRRDIPLFIRISYSLSYICYRYFGIFFENRTNPRIVELISKILYCVPYLLLKIGGRLL